MKQERLLTIMRKVAMTACIVAFLACLLTACKTVHDVRTEYVDRYVHDSIYIDKVDTFVRVDVQRDSVLLHDSVYVSVFQRADTIYKTREVWKYRDRISVKHDTIWDVRIDVQYRERVDTAYIDKVSIKTEYVKKPLSWSEAIGVGGIGIAVGGLLAFLYSRR